MLDCHTIILGFFVLLFFDPLFIYILAIFFVYLEFWSTCYSFRCFSFVKYSLGSSSRLFICHASFVHSPSLYRCSTSCCAHSPSLLQVFTILCYSRAIFTGVRHLVCPGEAGECTGPYLFNRREASAVTRLVCAYHSFCLQHPCARRTSSALHYVLQSRPLQGGNVSVIVLAIYILDLQGCIKFFYNIIGR